MKAVLPRLQLNSARMDGKKTENEWRTPYEKMPTTQHTTTTIHPRCNGVRELI